MKILLAFGIFMFYGIIIWIISDYLNRHFFKFDTCIHNIRIYILKLLQKYKKA
jgi:hypothetical protein